MNSILGMYMESWILRDPKYIHDSMNIPKIEFITYIYISL